MELSGKSYVSHLNPPGIGNAAASQACAVERQTDLESLLAALRSRNVDLAEQVTRIEQFLSRFHGGGTAGEANQAVPCPSGHRGQITEAVEVYLKLLDRLREAVGILENIG